MMTPNINIPELEFKHNFAACVARHRALRNAQRGCLILTSVGNEDDPFWMSAPLPALENIDFNKDPLFMPRVFCDRAEQLFAARADYPDDWIPYLSPRYGTGIVGGMLLGDLLFGSDTSWTGEVGSSLEEAINFPWGKENIWIDRVVEALNYMAKRLQGKCFVFLEGYETPLEWAATVRGSALYLEICTEPEQVHELLRRSDTALMWLYDLLETRVQKKEFGALAHSLWMEKRCIPFLSDDSAGLMSPSHYAEFGAPYTEAMFERLGGGFLHFHTLGYHQMENLSTMKSLTIYNWRQDPNTPQPEDILGDLLPGAQAKIVLISLTPAQIREKIQLLSQGRFVIYARCQTRREQEEIISFIHEKAPLIPA
ncbi:MAG: hypothetical protein WCL16_09720 [bacterium]